MQKSKYQIENWSEYNKSLIQRGSITIWVEEDSLKKWFSYECTGKAGRPPTYSNEAILMMLVLRERFGLSLRSLQGFIQSVFSLMMLTLPVTSYTQISRRAKTLKKHIKRLSKGSVKHLILDSTGLKVYGEGEWKVRTHGKSKRRTWRKLHIGIDAKTQDIVVCELTENNVGDAEAAERMLDKIPGKIDTVRGDGSYNPNAVRKKIYEKGARAKIPPPRHSSIKGATEGWERDRDEDVATIHALGGREAGRRPWKYLIDYFKRSLVETAIFRIKSMLGERLKARTMPAQCTEALCKCLVINKMNQLGLPKGKWISKAA